MTSQYNEYQSTEQLSNHINITFSTFSFTKQIYHKRGVNFDKQRTISSCPSTAPVVWSSVFWKRGPDKHARRQPNTCRQPVVSAENKPCPVVLILCLSLLKQRCVLAVLAYVPFCTQTFEATNVQSPMTLMQLDEDKTSLPQTQRTTTMFMFVANPAIRFLNTTPETNGLLRDLHII